MNEQKIQSHWRYDKSVEDAVGSFCIRWDVTLGDLYGKNTNIIYSKEINTNSTINIKSVDEGEYLIIYMHPGASLENTQETG